VEAEGRRASRPVAAGHRRHTHTQRHLRRAATVRRDRRSPSPDRAAASTVLGHAGPHQHHPRQAHPGSTAGQLAHVIALARKAVTREDGSSEWTTCKSRRWVHHAGRTSTRTDRYARRAQPDWRDRMTCRVGVLRAAGRTSVNFLPRVAQARGLWQSDLRRSRAARLRLLSHKRRCRRCVGASPGHGRAASRKSSLTTADWAPSTRSKTPT